MLDHSKRVSPQENVAAFYAWTGRRRDELVAWVGGRPLRRFLRHRSVSTTLGVAGMALSVAALLLVIGIGETQIVAAEDAGNHTANLFANGWFDVGIAFAVAGILLGAVAVSANGVQNAALKRFPDIEIRVLLHNAKDSVEEPDSGRRGRLEEVRLLIRNNERVRPVTLSVGLAHLVLPGTFPSHLSQMGIRTDRKASVPITWTPAAEDAWLPLGLNMLESPVHVAAQTQREGDVFFFIAEDELSMLEPNQRPSLSATDLRTYRSVEFVDGYPMTSP